MAADRQQEQLQLQELLQEDVLANENALAVVINAQVVYIRLG